MSGIAAPRFELPGTWGRVNLATEASTQRSIRKVVEYSVGRSDELASVRAELRGRFRDAADLARANGATDFHIALEIAPGVPMPAWLAVFLPDLASADFDALGIGELRAGLDAGLSSTAPDGAVTTAVKTRVQAVRQVFRRVQPAEEETPELELLQADYWLAAANPNRIALLTFTTNFVDLEEQMLGLFDAVIGTVRWPAPSGPAV